MGSQNVNFSAPILSLKGRAGLDLNLSLSYNSNLWVKNGSLIAFNTDKDVAGVGWNIGFGAIQGIPSGNTIVPFYDSTSNKMAFFYIEPDGTRHTLAQVGASNIYLSYDSSYLKYDNSDKRLYMIDGTWLHFITPQYNGSVIGKRLLPEFVVDRNGNSIKIFNAEIVNSNMYDVDPNDAIPPVAMPNPSHDWGIDYIVDTWGRVIDFVYESNLLVKVNQLRSSGPYNYITIAYAPITISTHFSGVTADPTGVNGSQVWQPWYLEYPTKHSTRLFYTSYGQMYLAEKWVPDAQHQGGDRPVAFTRYDMPTVSNYSAPGGATMKPGDDSTVSDCPKFATRWEWAENWVKKSAEGNYFPAIGYAKTYPVAVYSYEFNAGSNFTVVRDAVGRVFRTDISSDGLTHTSKIYANEGAYAGGAGAALKTGTTFYEKDAGLAYLSNQRPATVRVSDGVATKQTSYLYTNIGGANLPYLVYEYKDNGAAVYRITETTYNTDTAYLNRYILGLPSHTYVKTVGQTILAHTQYFYDDADANHFDSAYFDDIPNHNNTDYSASFISGRANLTRVMQYEIGGASRTTHTKYDRTGMVTAITNPDNAVTKFFYEEAHHAAPNRIVDAENKETGLWYYYYTGNIMQTHHLTSGTPENATFYGYDQFDRLVTVSRPDGGGIERMYWDNWMQVATFTKINTTSLEGFAITSFDGAGRVWYEGGDHPDGAAGKFSVRTYEYDAVGRRYWSSNPTQVSAVLDTESGHLTPTGDDAVSGYRWTNIQFDALDRVDLLIHPPYNSGGTLVNDTIDYDYSGCGCAGGSTITIRDERGKYRRTTYDSLGRLYESMELNASQGVYNRARYSYDERDLLQKIEHFDNGTTNYQTRSFTYDGYGRLASQTTPEAGTVSYQYSLDDQVTRVTDARGMYADYVYNARNLVTNVNYSEAATPDVTFTYGDYGERTMMRESLPSGTIGQTNYEYDPYKRLKKETRTFQDLPGKSYIVEYEYNYVDALKKIKYNMNGWQKEVNYSYNYTGAPTTIGTNLVSVGGLTTSNNILRDLNYRAFGAVKNVNYGNGRRMEATYDSNRMSLYQMVVKTQSGSGVIVNQVYDYHQGGANNGRIQKITDNWDGNYSATYTYDDYNRLSTVSSPSHSRSFSYDQWGNLTQTTASGNGETGSYGMSYSTVNGAPTNRLNHSGYGYDLAGNMTSDGWGAYTYDGASRLRTFGGAGNAWEYDGDGRKVKSISGGYPLYFVWSSVLNQPVAEVLSGGVYRAYVYDQGGRQLAQQSSDGLFYWLHTDHLGSGRKVTDVNGNVVYRGEFDAHGQTMLEIVSGTGSVWTITNKFTGYERNWATHIDYAKARGYNRYRNRFYSPDPLGIGAADPTNPQSLNRYSYVGNDPINNVDPSGLLACYIDGIESSCDMAFGMLESGAGVIGPSDSTRWNPGLNGGKGGFEHFSVDAAGTASWKSWQAIPKLGVEYDDGSYEVLEWDHVFKTTRTLGQVMEWNGQLAFRYRGEGVLDINGNYIGYRGVDNEIIGPADYLLGGGIARGSLKLIGGLSAVGRHFPKHHIFPQAKDLRPFFNNAGINIHKHTMQIPLPLHHSLHGAAGGPWVNAWREFFRNNPSAGATEIYKHAGELIYKFEIPGGPVIPYK